MSILKTTSNGSMKLPIDENPETVETSINDTIKKLTGADLFRKEPQIKLTHIYVLNSHHESLTKLKQNSKAEIQGRGQMGYKISYF